jgi:plasmid stabilization system protein ParE
VTYQFHFAAEAEHLQHVGYYGTIRSALAEQYLADFESTLQRVCEAPHRHRVEKKPDIRLVSLLKFPYFVIYRVVDSSVQVLAVPHFRQRPVYWAQRV